MNYEKTAKPLVSVIIPAFNAARFIRRTLDSVLCQTFTNFEVILVDDGSTDDTGKIAKSYCEKVRYIYQKNAGDGPARNTGINAAVGDWLAFLDHDDEWTPEKLLRQMQLLEQNPDLRWCATNFYRQIGNVRRIAFEQDKLSNALEGRAYFENFFTALSKKQAIFLTSTMVIKKEALDKAGVFDSCWLRCADADMWWRIAYHYPQIGFLQEASTIFYLDVQDAVGARLRFQARHGQDDRNLIARHLKLAREHNFMPVFRPLAKQVLHRSLLTAISHGLKPDARKIAVQFRSLIGVHWLIITYLLTIFPKLTSKTSQLILNLLDKLGLRRELSRRQIKSMESIKPE